MFKDKRAISTVVVTIMIVLVAIVAVTILWAALRPGIEKGAQTAGKKVECIGVSLSLTDLSCNNLTNQISGSVSRGSDSAGSIKMRIVVGNNLQPEMDAPISLGSTTILLNGTDGTNTVKVSPVIGETVCDPTDEKTVSC